jgi:hypothetical protein
MAKCNAQRRKRRRRDKKHLQRLAEKRFTTLALRADGGKSPEYYRVDIRVRTAMKNGKRYFSSGTRVRVMAKKSYHDLMDKLILMSKGLTVTIPRMIAQD